MRKRLTSSILTAAGLVVAALAAATPLMAQADSGQAPADTTKPAMAAATPLALPTEVPSYVNGHARALHLSGKQVDRIKKVHLWLKGADSTLRVQWTQVTGGRPPRSMTPEERHRLAPQLQPLIQQFRANNAAALDSVDAILTPAQQQQLQAMFAQYHPRRRAATPPAGQH